MIVYMNPSGSPHENCPICTVTTEKSTLLLWRHHCWLGEEGKEDPVWRRKKPLFSGKMTVSLWCISGLKVLVGTFLCEEDKRLFKRLKAGKSSQCLKELPWSHSILWLQEEALDGLNGFMGFEGRHGLRQRTKGRANTDNYCFLLFFFPVECFKKKSVTTLDKF